jgi:ABC-type transport system involved in multi-copper enzyme maturation permease subunit
VSAVRRVCAVARLELAEVLRSRWLVFSAVVYALLALFFILIGLRESSVLGFTGMGRVLLSFIHVLVLVLPLLALTATGQVVGQARDDGTLELLLSQPISRTAYLVAVTAVRYLVLVVPLVVLIGAMSLFATLALRQDISWAFVGRTLALSASLLWAFVGIGLGIATHVANRSRATIYLLFAWATAVALLDFALIGVMLQFRLNARAVFLLAALNPVQCVRMALLSGAEPELGVLGPVGFYLANRVGAPALFALGVVWPAVIGSAAWYVAARRFCTGDLV